MLAHAVGQALLFFGVDRRDADFIYKEELLERRKQVSRTDSLRPSVPRRRFLHLLSTTALVVLVESLL